ncbi:hypothetical protein [Sphingomonas lycopersici]|uniref:hypothetical protein n=1 Tax=Sphingomonas lycopersici TaxID=2951807 RepID=UPI002238BA85|nr:hypothetical protein [Sphingomonas lycopersici]
MLTTTPAMAQKVTAGRVANSAVGEVGKRQTKEQGVIGIEAMARVDNRIQNRVQSRIRNRIDRYYDPEANAISPFAVASDKARNAVKARRRP